MTEVYDSFTANILSVDGKPSLKHNVKKEIKTDQRSPSQLQTGTTYTWKDIRLQSCYLQQIK